MNNGHRKRCRSVAASWIIQTDWPLSSARFYAGEKDVALVMDPMVEFVGLC
jgi:hypothetical protein